jgi:hypothetical protein
MLRENRRIPLMIREKKSDTRIIFAPFLAHLKFHPPFFLFLAWQPSWLEVRITGHNFGRGPSKYHSTTVWLQLTQCDQDGRHRQT